MEKEKIKKIKLVDYEVLNTLGTGIMLFTQDPSVELNQPKINPLANTQP